MLSLGIDFSFNTIKTVRKVTWKDEAPWYCEIEDGMCWLCYCQNSDCQAYNSLVVVNRGYVTTSIERELRILVCPVCKKGN